MDSPLPPPTSPTGPASASTGSPPSRAVLLLHVLWRSVVLAVVGGAVIGVVVFTPFLFFDDETDVGTVASATVIAAILGLMLGVIGGIVLGVVAAGWLTPYRGARSTIKVIRIAAVVVVGLVFGVVFLGAAINGLTVAVVLLSVVATWFTSAFTINWYVRRMDAAALV
jgi:hypothetical protein